MTDRIEELRPLTAGRLLAIRQTVRRETEDPLEQALLCNAQVLAECCRRSGERVFSGREAVLERMTCREMEKLLGALATGEAPAATAGVSGENPGFDIGRFARLKEGRG